MCADGKRGRVSCFILDSVPGARGITGDVSKEGKVMSSVGPPGTKGAGERGREVRQRG